MKQGIYAKLLEFQKLEVSLVRDNVNAHYKNKYADISEVISKVRPALSKVGITLVQTPGETGLTSILYDAESDTKIECFLPYINATDPQKLGSNLTYLRRYSLVTMLGLEDEDDDANTATAKTAPEKTPAKPAAPKAPAPTLEQAFSLLRSSLNMDELKANFTKLPAAMRKDAEIVALKDELKAALTA